MNKTNKVKKVIAIIVAFVCLTLHIAVISCAAEDRGVFRTSLPAFQEKVRIFTGKKLNGKTNAFIKVASGNVNYMYVQIRAKGGSKAFCDWSQIPNDGNVYKVYYSTQPANNTELDAIAYQKNVLSKQANGSIVL